MASSYLHSPVALDRERILRAAATLVRPGGTLVVVGHAGPPSWADGQHHGHGHGHALDLPGAAEVVAGLALDDGWNVERAVDVDCPSTAPDGTPGTRHDCVVRATRRTTRA